MRVLFNCDIPFMLAHGGVQVQIEQTKAALEQIGVEVAFLEWWNEGQTGDVLHHFCAPSAELIRLARRKGWRTASTILLSANCNRSKAGLLVRRLLYRAIMAAPLPRAFRLPRQALRLCDQVFVGLEAERQILVRSYGVDERRVRRVPLGLREGFLKAGPGRKSGDYLITHGTIAPVKNSVELARAAREARVPVLFVGKPFAQGSGYWEEFRGLVDDRYVRYRAHVGGEAEMVGLLQEARGFVLMSRFENWSLAAHEAAACGLPLLLPDLPWSRELFGGQASYFGRRVTSRAARLRKFYERSGSAAPPKVRLYSWREVAGILRDAYAESLSRSGPAA